MKTTHEDRVNLIDRLERKYARKIRLHNQTRRQNIKNALRAMRGRRMNEVRMESMDGIFRHGPTTA